MKLLTYDAGSGPRVGVLVGDRVQDVTRLLAVPALQDVRALLELPGDPLRRLEAALAAPVTEGLPLNGVRLRAPILQPPTVRDFMVYEGHASGGGTRPLSDAWYRLPIFYFSNTLRIFGSEQAVPYRRPSARDPSRTLQSPGTACLAGADCRRQFSAPVCDDTWSARTFGL